MFCHLNVKTGSRATGQSAAAKYDYISRECRYADARQDEVVHVESGSMEPTLAPGDRILVNKLADNPSRGDLVVFSRPDGDLVKRVVALEGETLYFDDGLLKIGESWLVEPYLSAGTGTYVRAAIPNCDPTEGFGGNEACTVPEGHVFVLGDNRSVSFDSRNFGPVPRESLIGNAALQFWPLGDLRSF